MVEREDERRIGELREELRSLGYLDSRLERFFLSDIGGQGGFFSANLKNALRLGLTGGFLVALLLTLGTLGTTPELARAPADLVVLGAYFTLASALCIALVEFLAAWLVRSVQRIGLVGHFPVGRIAWGFGWLFGLASLAYWSLWWRTHVVRDPAPWWIEAAALVLGLLASLAIGRFAALAAFGVLARLVPAEGLRRRQSARHRLGSLVLVGAVVYAGLFLVIRGSSGDDGFRAASPYRVDATTYRVLFVGVDGLTHRLVEELETRGHAPGLATLREVSAHAPLSVLPDRVPSVVWTSIATGQDPLGHGIRAMQAERMPGVRTPFQLRPESGWARALASMGSAFRITEPRPVSTALRQVKAIWDVLSDQGRSVGVVGWWATWPAEPVNGFIVTDRLFFKLRKGGPFERETDSVELYDRLAASFARDRREAVDALGPLLEEALDLGGQELAMGLQRDSYHLGIGDRLRHENRPDLHMVYFSGLDLVAMMLFEPPRTELASMVRAAALVRSYALWIDAALASLLEGLSEDEILVVVADPGRFDHAAESRGVFYVAGEPFRRGVNLDTVSEYDVAPTLLHVLGFPRSKEMRGRVWEEALCPEWASAHPVESIETFGSKRVDRAALRSRFDEEMLNQLKALGYIQ